MKKIAMIVSILLVAVLSVAMVGCSSYGSLKKAFEKEGYEVVEEMEGYNDKIKTLAEKDNLEVTVHGMKKIDGLASTLVIIVEFQASEDMKKLYDDSEMVKGFVKDVSSNEDVKEWVKTMEEAGYAKDNCLVFTINPLAITTVANIVKNA